MPSGQRKILTFAKSPISNLGSHASKLHLVPLKMSPSVSANWPPVARKLLRLQALNPDVAAVIERLVDRYLAEVS